MTYGLISKKGEGKHPDKPFTQLAYTHFIAYTLHPVKFPIRTGPAWDLRPKISHPKRILVPSSGMLIGDYDDGEM